MILIQHQGKTIFLTETRESRVLHFPDVAGHFSQSVRKNFFEGFFEEYDEEYDEEYALDFRPQRAQEACNGDAAFCAFWLLEASDSQSSFQRSQQMTELLSS